MNLHDLLFLFNAPLIVTKEVLHLGVTIALVSLVSLCVCVCVSK